MPSDLIVNIQVSCKLYNFFDFVIAYYH